MPVPTSPEIPSAGPMPHWTIACKTKVYAEVLAQTIMNGTSMVPELISAQ